MLCAREHPRMRKSVRIASLLILASCGQPQAEPRDDEPAAPEEEPAVAPPASDPAPPPEPASVQRVVIDQPPARLQVAPPPGLELVVEEHGEYRVDVSGSEERDPRVHLFRGDELVEEDDDSGDGTNARIVRFLEPGTYSVRVAERSGRPFEASIQVAKLPPLEPAGTVVIGPALDVPFPPRPNLERPETDRDAARSVTLTIEREGDYHCTARMDNARLARMQVIQDGRVLVADDQRFTEIAATVSHHFTPGRYEIRVWDVDRRGDMRATVMCDPDD
jgi:hypothetical protein